MVSVIIPTYNREKTIIRSIKSVLNQTYSNLECIVVDDCSTDNTEAIVSQISDKRVIYIKLRARGGACVARNVGISHSNGDYVAFQDSDDEWLIDKLEKQIKVMEEEKADICFCSKKQVMQVGSSRFLIRPQGIRRGFVTHKQLVDRSLASTQLIICRSEIADAFSFDPKVEKYQDFDWIIRAGKDHSVFFLDEPLVIQYLQNDSITTRKDGIILLRNSMEYFYEKYQDEYPMRKYWKLSLLNQLAYYKGVIGENNSREYSIIWGETKRVKDLFKMLLANIGIMKLIQMFRYNVGGMIYIIIKSNKS